MTLLPETRHWLRETEDLRRLTNTIVAEMSDDLTARLGDDTIDIAGARRALETATVCFTAAMQRLEAHEARHTPEVAA